MRVPRGLRRTSGLEFESAPVGSPSRAALGPAGSRARAWKLERRAPWAGAADARALRSDARGFFGPLAPLQYVLERRIHIRLGDVVGRALAPAAASRPTTSPLATFLEPRPTSLRSRRDRYCRIRKVGRKEGRKEGAPVDRESQPSPQPQQSRTPFHASPRTSSDPPDGSLRRSSVTFPPAALACKNCVEKPLMSISASRWWHLPFAEGETDLESQDEDRPASHLPHRMKHVGQWREARQGGDEDRGQSHSFSTRIDQDLHVDLR